VHLLIVEDDAALRNLLRRLLTRDRHLVELAATGTEAIETVESTNGLDALILDIGLPDIGGLEVARRLRSKRSRLPILMLTARDAIEDKVAGLDAGADDYLVKPFAYEELAARLRALGRRGHETAGGAVMRCGPIRLDELGRMVKVDGRAVDLTQREFALLECLLRHRGQVLSRDQLLDHAWPYGSAITLNSVDAYVHHLRTKLGAAGRLIETVRGIGYRMRRQP
jgi:DNA-binding response OmpR family regulator